MALYRVNADGEIEAGGIPNLETFYAERNELSEHFEDGEHDAGWFYWWCFPGCMPDSDPFGPYESEEAALAAAREL